MSDPIVDDSLTVYTKELLDVASHCQLITGSYDGRQRCCDCDYHQDCVFSDEDRRRLWNHPTLVEIRDKEWKKWKEQQDH